MCVCVCVYTYTYTHTHCRLDLSDDGAGAGRVVVDGDVVGPARLAALHQLGVLFLLLNNGVVICEI